jgi:hypothetical protein
LRACSQPRETDPMRPSASPHLDPTVASLRGVQLRFDPSVAMAEVEDTLELARLAAESLLGPERVQLDAQWDFDVDGHTVDIGTSSEVGRTLAIVFLGFVKREFGPDAARVMQTGVAR